MRFSQHRFCGSLSTDLEFLGSSLVDQQQQFRRGLRVALADTYMVYGDTQSVHWNATGPLFFSVHQLTEMQYKDLAEAKANSERARAAAEKADAEAQKQLWSKIDALKSKAESAQKRLDELKRSTEEQASRLKSEVGRLVA